MTKCKYKCVIFTSPAEQSVRHFEICLAGLQVAIGMSAVGLWFVCAWICSGREREVVQIGRASCRERV